MHGWWRKGSILLFCISACFLTKTQAQVSLTEFGVRAGGGLHVGAPAALTGYNSLKVMGFATHFACGKPYGYHLEAGVRYSNYQVNHPLTGQPSSRVSGNLITADIGTYFKLRSHKQNAKREWAFLIGPKASVTLYSQFGDQDIASPPTFSDRSTIQAALHLSAYYKLPAGKTNSIFLHPGVEYYALPFTLVAGSPARSLYIFFTVGYTFWNSL